MLSLNSRASEAPFFFSFTCQLSLLFFTAACFGSEAAFMPSVVSKSSPLFCWDLNIFLFLSFTFFLCVFHSVQPNPLVAKQWLMALLASPEGEGAQLPGSSGSSQSFACHPPPPYPSLPCSPPPSLQKPPITQPFSEVI